MAAKGLYACLCAHGNSFIGVETLAALSGSGKDATRAALNQLVAHGFVEAVHRGSGPEEVASSELSALGVEFEREFTFHGCKDKRHLRFDFYIGELDMAIEIDGPGHFVDVYGPAKEIQRRDAIKDEYCKQQGILLVRIPFQEFHSLRERISHEVRQRQASRLGVGATNVPC
jgi:very-short-patch-repair endonuclease